jgi:hypothetical protein
MHVKIKIGMFEQLSKPLKMDGIQVSLLDVACLNYMQNVIARKLGKMITHFFGSKTYIWMRKYNIVVIVFNFDFEGEMNYFVPYVYMRANVFERDMKPKICNFFNLVH